MPRLIQLRQRIHAVETIKKITHAMRLISMSSHSHMRNAREPLNAYVAHLQNLFSRILCEVPTWNHPLMQIKDTASSRTLTIIVGSQKSLCGSFNTFMLAHTRSHMKTINHSTNDAVVIGKKMVDLLQNAGFNNWITTYPSFTSQHLTSITRALSHLILNSDPAYTHVTILSNHGDSFFLQRPKTNVLVPLGAPETMPQEKKLTGEPFSWDQSSDMVLSHLLEQYLESRIYLILFESLLAEQAARFVSMDSSTRNAKNMLDAMNIQYNKLRQAKITKELTELSSSYS